MTGRLWLLREKSMNQFFLHTFMIICHNSSDFSENIDYLLTSSQYFLPDWVGPLQRCSGQYFGNITYYINYHSLLYKHKWNTRWAFARKFAIFTCEHNMLSSHVKISPLLWLHNKSRLSHQKTVKVKWFGISSVFI